MRTLVIGIDTGGTFTDFVLMKDGQVRVHKEPSTPDNPAAAILVGLETLGVEGVEIVHGSTVATNALLERRGARTALVTTAGFEDVLEIGRQTRPAIYDLGVSKPAPLVDTDARLGLHERIDPQGGVVEPVDPESVADTVERIRQGEYDAVAICLLHAYANPAHERALLSALTDGFTGFITASHQVVPEFREYERTSTTVVNAYVGPIMQRYLGQLAEQLSDSPIRIMQSNGGSISLQAAQRAAIQTVLSGPAGGVVGGAEIGRLAGFPNSITFDMGGTSTDVSLCQGQPGRTAESSVGGLPIRLPVIDIHTVGAGGGSIAYRDPGGALKVGPRSAGAQPGPICYGRGGTEVTVTDANLFLGRLAPDHFLGGDQHLAQEPVAEVMKQLADELGMAPVELAEGVVRVANTTMAGAIRVISVERGFDPRDFSLVSFGGAGSMHAAALARDLGIPRVIVPFAAGILSALGMLLTDIVRDYSQTLLVAASGLQPGVLEAEFLKLEARALEDFALDELNATDLRYERSVDLRYIGQGYELEVPMQADFEAAFHELHEQRYGYSDPERPTEVVNVRLRVVAPTQKPAMDDEPLTEPDSAAAIVGDHEMVFDQELHKATLIDRNRLHPGGAFTGPALVVEYSTTTVVPPGVGCHIDGQRNLVMEINP
ncbi:MAG TPA: hydantoinase/oxoprolinase family protein [Acidobacteriota bacterium]|nr:hydantoinase/oxoprolinase family protein [Acidobacteriota bacterium]